MFLCCRAWLTKAVRLGLALPRTACITTIPVLSTKRVDADDSVCQPGTLLMVTKAERASPMMNLGSP